MKETALTPVFNKVMVVDDSEIDRFVASTNIKRYAVAGEVILKASASSALHYLKSLVNSPGEIPNLIFLDINMPEINGFGFLEEFQHLPDAIRQNCIIMMLSTSLDPGDHEKAKNNKYVTQFVNKPLDKDKIREIFPVGNPVS